nr:group III truncated hemoglobin [uncultured Flavobacterium sp.]
MQDIQTRADLEKLLWAFYTKLLADPAISYIFTDVAKINLEEHMPSLTDFWEQVLLGRNGYRKNVMQIHLDLNADEPLTQEHFNIWLQYFNTTVDEMYEGETAENAKTRALSIATVMQIKLQQ